VTRPPAEAGALRDKRRLGRALIEPDFSHVGPDAAEVGRDVFRDRVGRGSTALKARLLDQGVIAGVGTCSPTRRSGEPACHPAGSPAS
jgi:formamidopyrimidine-DNA glycosylase